MCHRGPECANIYIIGDLVAIPPPPPSDKECLILGESIELHIFRQQANLLALGALIPWRCLLFHILKARYEHIWFSSVLIKVAPLFTKVMERELY